MSLNNIAALLLLLILVAVPAAADGDFDGFKTLHQRNYVSPEEEQYRKTMFRINVEFIKAHNSNADRTYDLGENKFADMPPDEFRSKSFLI
jgi:cathepsin L